MKSKLLSLALGAVTTISISTLATQAQALTFNLNFTGAKSTGTGTATIDDALFIPNQNINNPNGPLTGLTGFQATFTGLSTTPSSTTFNLSDLVGYTFVTDADAKVTDFNFFQQSAKTNADGYSINGFGQLALRLSNINGTVDEYAISATSAAVPFEFSPTAGTALFSALFGLKLALKSKAKKKSLVLSESKA